ncbi:MAG: dTDP-4-dehydrorhamnose 3,5-epimerase family protein [Lentimicrobiaceae bacterium]|nr:dTDP-4-dehydrorhamnose 3,5-epimerase family protein [Lentimicrobiaceae bacterium]
MRIEETFISGLKLIHLKEFKDQRGSFIKVFNEEFFKENGLETNFKESYYSISAKNVIRGMHFQVPPAEHTKLVYLNSGSILDVVLDLRKDSQTFGQYFSVELTVSNPVLIYIPIGCAHGFLSLEDNSMVTYLQTTCYHPTFDCGIRYDSFGYNWPVDNPIISQRDGGFKPIVTI